MGGSSGALLFGKNVGGTLDDLNSSKKTANRKIQYLQYQQLQNIKNNQNILEKQLASRRARLGSVGLTSSSSENALQHGMIGDTYKEIAEKNMEYSNQYSMIKNEYKKKLHKSLFDLASPSMTPSADDFLNDSRVIK